MDPWKELAVFQESRDAVRAWAELEGKSPLMADDLAQRYSPPPRKPPNWPFALGLGLRLAAWLVESWWSITRR